MKKIIALCFAVFITGCATTKYTDPDRDPYEPFNRKIFTFNMALDKAIFRPVARAYDTVVPARVACSIGNFFDNIDDITSIANNILQFKLYDAWSDTWRVALNSTLGVLGLFDVASPAGLVKHHQDFGLTLAYWGMTKTQYLMVPFFGPSTVRDTVGWSVDWNYLSIWPYIEPMSLRYGLYGLRLVHKRALLLPADKLIDEAIDPYIFVRDAYLQKRDCDIKSLRPCCPDDHPDDAKGESSNAKNNEDTFVPDDNNTADSGDTFVSEEGNDDQNKTAKNASNTTKGGSSGDDTFVEP